MQMGSLAGDAVAQVATRSGTTEKYSSRLAGASCDSRWRRSCRNREQEGATDHLPSIESDDPEFLIVMGEDWLDCKSLVQL